MTVDAGTPCHPQFFRVPAVDRRLSAESLKSGEALNFEFGQIVIPRYVYDPSLLFQFHAYVWTTTMTRCALVHSTQTVHHHHQTLPLRESVFPVSFILVS